MKKMFLFLSISLIINISSAQVDFRWEKIDSVKKSKSQIYSDTKMFIAEFWKSAQNVIQNDDKESGMILVKGASSKSCTYLLNPHSFIFSYTVKFFMKENKFKIQIDNVSMTSHTCSVHTWGTIQPVDNFDGNENLSAKRGNEIFAELKKELQSIFDNYIDYIKKPVASNNNW